MCNILKKTDAMLKDCVCASIFRLAPKLTASNGKINFKQKSELWFRKPLMKFVINTTIGIQTNWDALPERVRGNKQQGV